MARYHHPQFARTAVELWLVTLGRYCFCSAANCLRSLAWPLAALVRSALLQSLPRSPTPPSPYPAPELHQTTHGMNGTGCSAPTPHSLKQSQRVNSGMHPYTRKPTKQKFKRQALSKDSCSISPGAVQLGARSFNDCKLFF